MADDTGFTRVPNAILDAALCDPRLHGAAFRIFMAIARKTYGWRKDTDAISYRQLLDLTGIKSPSTIHAAIAELTSAGYIEVTTGGKWDAATYRIATTITVVEQPATITVATTESVVDTTTVIVAAPTTITVDTKERSKERKKDIVSRKRETSPTTPAEIRTTLADVCLVDLAGGTKADVLQVNTVAAALWKQAQAKKADAADVVTGIHRTADYCQRKVFPFSKGERLKPSAIQSNWRAAYEEASHGAIRSNGRIHDDTGAAATPIRYKSTIARRNGSTNRDGDRLPALPPVDRTETNEGVIQRPTRTHLE